MSKVSFIFFNCLPVIVKELLNFLIECEDEVVTLATQTVCTIIEYHAPHRRWQVDNLTRVLSLAGKYVSDDSICTFLQLIAATNELQAYAIVKTFSALRDNIYQDALARVTFWVIGEFSNLIHNGEARVQISEIFSKMADLISDNCDQTIKCYILNCLVKMYVKIPGIESHISKMIQSMTTDEHDETQQRAFEYYNIINCDALNLEQKASIMDAMPVAQKSAKIFNT